MVVVFLVGSKPAQEEDQRGGKGNGHCIGDEEQKCSACDLPVFHGQPNAHCAKRGHERRGNGNPRQGGGDVRAGHGVCGGQPAGQRNQQIERRGVGACNHFTGKFL